MTNFYVFMKSLIFISMVHNATRTNGDCTLCGRKFSRTAFPNSSGPTRRLRAEGVPLLTFLQSTSTSITAVTSTANQPLDLRKGYTAVEVEGNMSTLIKSDWDAHANARQMRVRVIPVRRTPFVSCLRMSRVLGGV